MEFIETIGKLVVRYHSFFEEGIVNTLIIAAFTVFFGTDQKSTRLNCSHNNQSRMPSSA